MTRKTIKTVFLVLLAVFTLSAISEAAPKRTVHPRTRHSRRVSAARPTLKKNQTRRLPRPPAAKRTVKRKTTTKPR